MTPTPTQLCQLQVYEEFNFQQKVSPTRSALVRPKGSALLKIIPPYPRPQIPAPYSSPFPRSCAVATNGRWGEPDDGGRFHPTARRNCARSTPRARHAYPRPGCTDSGTVPTPCRGVDEQGGMGGNLGRNPASSPCPRAIRIAWGKACFIFYPPDDRHRGDLAPCRNNRSRAALWHVPRCRESPLACPDFAMIAGGQHAAPP
jgi:hypothetical protein